MSHLLSALILRAYFKLFDEVLPSIRKHGVYVCPFAGAHADGKSLFIRLQGRIVQGGIHLWHFTTAQ